MIQNTKPGRSFPKKRLPAYPFSDATFTVNGTTRSSRKPNRLVHVILNSLLTFSESCQSAVSDPPNHDAESRSKSHYVPRAVTFMRCGQGRDTVTRIGEAHTRNIAA